jgi:hypothetical protein
LTILKESIIMEPMPLSFGTWNTQRFFQDIVSLTQYFRFESWHSGRDRFAFLGKTPAALTKMKS